MLRFSYLEELNACLLITEFHNVIIMFSLNCLYVANAVDTQHHITQLNYFQLQFIKFK